MLTNKDEPSVEYDEVTDFTDDASVASFNSFTSLNSVTKSENQLGFLATNLSLPIERESIVLREKLNLSSPVVMTTIQEGSTEFPLDGKQTPEEATSPSKSLDDDMADSKGGTTLMQLPQMGSPGGEEEDDDEEEGQTGIPEGAYEPSDYDHLDVNPEVKELFSFITRYTPQTIDLEHRLRPFIPDYIPAVGDIDAFIKIPRSDNEASTVGLTVLDEPSAKQSDATVLDLQLRALAKHTTAKTVAVKRVDSAEKNPKIIEKWVRDISDLHRAKPPPTVHYSKRMPEIDTLMQEWPGEVEELLKEVNLPSAALQADLPQYVDIICAILDIPVYKNRIHSLHILFTLYSVFKNSAHFRQLAEENLMENEDENTDKLVL